MSLFTSLVLPAIQRPPCPLTGPLSSIGGVNSSNLISSLPLLLLYLSAYEAINHKHHPPPPLSPFFSHRCAHAHTHTLFSEGPPRYMGVIISTTWSYINKASPPHPAVHHLYSKGLSKPGFHLVTFSDNPEFTFVY